MATEQLAMNWRMSKVGTSKTADLISRESEPYIDQSIRTAIRERRLMRLHYQEREKTVEPHDYGIQNGVVRLLAFQIAGSSRGRLPNWRWLDIDKMSDVQLFDQTFPGGRPSGKHHIWDELFIR